MTIRSIMQMSVLLKVSEKSQRTILHRKGDVSIMHLLIRFSLALSISYVRKLQRVSCMKITFCKRSFWFQTHKTHFSCAFSTDICCWTYDHHPLKWLRHFAKHGKGHYYIVGDELMMAWQQQMQKQMQKQLNYLKVKQSLPHKQSFSPTRVQIQNLSFLVCETEPTMWIGFGLAHYLKVHQLILISHRTWNGI